MIHIVSPDNEHLFRNEMEQAYRLRHQVFVKEMGWHDLAKPDGREIDQFDNKHAVHMLYVERGEVLGYQRFLPSTRPHLLSDVMPELCEVPRPVGTHIWEWTRFCVERGHRVQGRAVCPLTNMLLTAAVEWGLESGITQFIIQTNATWLLRMVQLHFRPLPLGLPKKISGEDIIAITASFDERTLMRLRDMRGDTKRVLAEQARVPSLLHA
ncbi:MAG TPA: acyl-homoserine-lactone synthase [Methylocella sp.]|nr:acyl-homoserine-lactone synthase [Methylocella sp.]